MRRNRSATANDDEVWMLMHSDIGVLRLQSDGAHPGFAFAEELRAVYYVTKGQSGRAPRRECRSVAGERHVKTRCQGEDH